MSAPCLDIVMLGLSITSSWGNGHATTYRGLVRALEARGHRVLFLERDVPWYAAARDLPAPPYGCTALSSSLEELRSRFTTAVQRADAVIVGSYVPEGIAVGDWVLQTARGVTAFAVPVREIDDVEGPCGVRAGTGGVNNSPQVVREVHSSVGLDEQAAVGRRLLDLPHTARRAASVVAVDERYVDLAGPVHALAIHAEAPGEG